MLNITTHSARLSQTIFLTGDSVIAYTGSANHDERAFSHPDVFDVTRTANKHLAFGHGIHFCIGAPLARLEAPIAIRQMLTHMQNIQRVPGVTLEPSFVRSLYGVKRLPITFTPIR